MAGATAWGHRTAGVVGEQSGFSPGEVSYKRTFPQQSAPIPRRPLHLAGSPTGAATTTEPAASPGPAAATLVSFKVRGLWPGGGSKST